MEKKLSNFLYSVILALGVIASFFFNTTSQKVIITLFVTSIFILFSIYNNKKNKI
ncbi:hypothetical protein [Enterococcus plantarum]|uniref:hypothetical protein n=1 Tax=Enterococcus plantarum TaxID=1077675 RepID=UPI001A8EF917|nr:hypothetical protein [Enterococcus plantarum]MBO0423278.1 hypothetical protein [Enterococcus plantarum]